MRKGEQLHKLCAVIASTPIEGAYLFGSWRAREDPNDFDILLVYDLEKCSARQIINLKQKIRETAPAIFGLPAHVVMLTTDEEKQVRFIETENCVLLDCAKQIFPP